MKIRLTQLDGKTPNMALMKLSHYHRSQGHEIYFSRSPKLEIGEPEYDRVYGSVIFSFESSIRRLQTFKFWFPDAIIGGTGSGSNITIEK